MDCVTCEKCKVWGKLQILGIGTAIKILLSSEQDIQETLHAIMISKNPRLVNKFLNRQEIISLVNTLHQFAKSVEFASHASERELSEKLALFKSSGFTFSIIFFIFIIFFLFFRKLN